MKKKLWRTIISFTIVLLILEICFAFWANVKMRNETLRIQAFKKSIVGCEIVDKTFRLSEKNNHSIQQDLNNSSSVIFPSYTDTIESEENGWITVNNPKSLLVMVNKKRKLPDNYIPPKLVIPDVRFSFDGIEEKKHLRKIAATSLESLFKEAEKEGHLLFAVSGYRSYQRQVSVFDEHVQTLGEEKAKEVSAIPGSSEHQTGLSMDVSSESANFLLSTDFGSTPEGKWLSKNSHKFGFIIRYPKNKTAITGYNYEPWHIRYIGVQHATYLYKNNLTLEEVIK